MLRDFENLTIFKQRFRKIMRVVFLQRFEKMNFINELMNDV